MTDDTRQTRPTHAEAARTLVATSSGRAVLSTLEPDTGHPYGSVVEFALLDDGDPVLFLSDLAEHTDNFKADPRVSLVCWEEASEARTLALGRVTLVGAIEQVESTDELREAYLERHPHAASYIDFSDFSFYLLRVERLRYIGGFGRMSWTDLDDYRSAEADPLHEAADGIITHMNEDHADACLDYAVGLAGLEWAEQARMTGVDRYGFDLDVTGDDQRESVRIPFDAPVSSPGEVREATVELVQRARSA